ncbi:class I SAM-dependent methyltransferase [Devosia sp.]|uniref:class I SAM-dependent methyltransferase n=1 Tax=Devosia sp. TaxID=1871048 RepID=UPI002EFDCB36
MTTAETDDDAGSTRVLLRTPSFPRLRRLWAETRSKSILRALEYERLHGLGLSGRVLDFGGGKRINYAGRIAAWADPAAGFDYESANIDAATDPTYLLAPDADLPCEDGRYDAVLALNTLEHVYGLSATLRRLHRVLRPGGELIVTVPFLFPVHGHPDDYTRGTPSFWHRVLAEHGFGEVVVEALTWGPFSTAATVVGTPGPLKRLRVGWALLLDLAYHAARSGLGVTLTERQDAPLCRGPFGYFIRCARVAGPVPAAPGEG